jgi:GrpB-like predicted nucleotidyltransferase (UPF0157 family)
VPGLAAKPVIDMLLIVADSGNEKTYLPALESAGYVLLSDWLQEGEHNRTTRGHHSARFERKGKAEDGSWSLPLLESRRLSIRPGIDFTVGEWPRSAHWL